MTKTNNAKLYEVGFIGFDNQTGEQWKEILPRKYKSLQGATNAFKKLIVCKQSEGYDAPGEVEVIDYAKYLDKACKKCVQVYFGCDLVMRRIDYYVYIKELKVRNKKAK